MKFKYYIFTIITCMLGVIVNCMPFSVIIGSSVSFFSFSNGILPLLGAFGGSYGALLGLFIKSLLRPSNVFSAVLVHKLPGFCASLYWSINRMYTQVIIPCAMMMLFLIHPVGCYAFLYPLLWTIPPFLFYINATGFFYQALSATLLSHAIGSVAWLYLFPSMAPSMWHALIPLALCERISFAVIMSLVRYTMLTIQSYLTQAVSLCVTTEESICAKVE